GLLTVDTTAGTVTGHNKSGILAQSNGAGIVVKTADVHGGDSGVSVRNYGTALSGHVGDTVVDTTAGKVTGKDGNGIDVVHYGANLKVKTGKVSGGDDGLHIMHGGTDSDVAAPGDTIITTAGRVTGKNGVGIFANNNYQKLGALERISGDLIITANGVVTGV